MQDHTLEQWLNIDEVRLKVEEQYFHHHAYEIIETHKEFKETFLACIQNAIEVDTIERNKPDPKGIGAKKLNKEIRRLLKGLDKIQFEVNEVDGVFHFSEGNAEISGFDFAIIDHKSNIVNFRNRCFGSLSYSDGESRWKNFIAKNESMKDIANEIYFQGSEGKDVPFSNGDPSLVILGEIQFGNWALSYRDIFKVLKANVHNTVDCLIYIVPTGHLERSLSDGIVTYNYLTAKVLKSFEKVVSVPVWVIGLDIEI